MDVSQVLVGIVQNAVPYMLASRAVNPLFALILLPLLLFAVKALPGWLERAAPRTYSVNIHSSGGETTAYENEAYFAVVLYIKNVAKVPHIQYDIETASISGFGLGIPTYCFRTVPPDAYVEVGKCRIGLRAWRDGSGKKHDRILSLFVLPSKGGGKEEEKGEKAINKLLATVKKYFSKNNLFAVYEAKEKRFVSRVEKDAWAGRKLKNNKTFDTLFLREDVGKELLRDLEEFGLSKEFCRQQALPHKRGYLLHGPPGTGKSSAYHAIANMLKRNIYLLKFSQCSTTADLYQMVGRIPNGSVVAVDEVDQLAGQVAHQITVPLMSSTSYGKSPFKTGDVTTVTPSLADLLHLLDGFEYLRDCIIVFTTNNLDKIPPALIRPGRIDRILYVGLPNGDVLNRMWRRFFDAELGLPPVFEVPLSTAFVISSIVLPHWRDEPAARKLLHSLLAAPPPQTEPRAEA
jgi:hypothetical protein